jgi:hypothetical protein
MCKCVCVWAAACVYAQEVYWYVTDAHLLG